MANGIYKAAILHGSAWQLSNDVTEIAKADEGRLIFVDSEESLRQELTSRCPQEPDATFLTGSSCCGISVFTHPLPNSGTPIERIVELAKKYNGVLGWNSFENHQHNVQKLNGAGLIIKGSEGGYAIFVYDPDAAQKQCKKRRRNEHRGTREGRMPWSVFGPGWDSLCCSVSRQYEFIKRMSGAQGQAFVFKHMPKLVHCLRAIPVDRFTVDGYVKFLRLARPYRRGILKAVVVRREKPKSCNAKLNEWWDEKIAAYEAFGRFLTSEIHALCDYLRTKKGKKNERSQKANHKGRRRGSSR